MHAVLVPVGLLALVLSMPGCVCREWVLFQLKMNEMNEKLSSFTMNVIFTSSIYMGKNFMDILYNIMSHSTGIELQSI